MRSTGNPIIGDVPWGTHFCQFYRDTQDLIDILVPYFKAGLENNEFCMWVTSEPLGVDEAKAALAAEVDDLESYIRRGQLEILDYSEWYTAGGKFESDRVLRGWVDRLQAALGRGFDGLRLTGNTFWLEKADWQGFTEYEAAVDGVIGQYNMLAICTYSLARCGAVEIMDVVSNHAFALIKRADQWEIIESAERKKVEASLRESEERLRMAIASTGLGTWDFDPQGGTLLWSDLCKRHFGLPPEREVSYDTFLRGLHPDDRERVHQIVQGVLRPESGGQYQTEYRTIGIEDGQDRWIAAMGRAFFDREGRPVRFTGTTLDVTELKRAEEALRDSEEHQKVAAAVEAEQQRLYGILEKLPVMVCLLAPDHQVRFANRRFREFFGESNGRRCFDYVFNRPDPCPECQSFTPLKTCAPHHWEWDTPKGAYMDIYDFPFTDPDGSPLVLEVDMDVTDRKRAEAELAKHRQHLEELVKERTRELEAANAQLQAEIAERKNAEDELRRNREWLRVTLTSIGDAVLATDTAGRITFLNPIAAGLLGWPPEDALGSPVWDVFKIIDETTRCPAEDLVERVLREANTVSMANHSALVSRDGREIPIEDSAAPIRDSAGHVAGVVIVFHDVTEKRRAQDALKQSESKYRQTLDSIPGMVFTTRPDGYCDYQSQQWVEYTGVPMSDHLGDGWNRLLHPEDQPRAFAAWRAAVEGRAPYDLEYRVRRHDGAYEWFRVIGRPIRDAAGAIVRWFGVAVNIGQLKRSEDALRESEARYRSLFESMDEGFASCEMIHDAAGQPVDFTYLAVNPSFTKLTGISAEHAVGRTVREIIPKIEPFWIETYGRVARTGESERIADQVLSLDKHFELFAWRSAPGRFAVVFNDVTERKRAEERIRHQNKVLDAMNRIFSEALLCETEEELGRRCLAIAEQVTESRFGFIGESNAEGRLDDIAISDPGWEACRMEHPTGHRKPPMGFTIHGIYGRVLLDGRGFFTNDPASHPDSIGTPAGHPPLKAFLGVPLKHDRKTIGMIAVGNREGGYRPQDLECLEALALAVVQVLMRKRAERAVREGEERLRQAQKMESIGVLAGGIAHDFNNLLTGILGNASLLQMEAPVGNGEQLKAIMECSEKAAALTRQLLAYAGKGQFQITDFDVSRLVRSSADLLRISIPKNIDVMLDVPRNLPAVRGDSSQIQQVVMNLVINAAEATEGRNDGRVSISAGVRDLDASGAGRVGSGIAPGHYVLVTVSDNGCGMDEQTRSTIFEPFFTTKFTGRGLGLAAVHGILRSHKGTITVESTPGKGSTFTVYLPCSEARAASSARRTEVSGTNAATVLVIDDEEHVRTFTMAALERIGHSVLLAENGRQALDLLARHADVDLVVLDIIMPVLGGVEAFSEMRKKWPRLPVLAASGYTREEACRLGMPSDLPFIQKPYTVQILGAAVEKALKGQGRDSE